MKSDLPKFSILFAGDDLGSWQRYVKRADSLGFWGLGIGDSQSIYADVYVRTALAAIHTESIRVGPLVTNPVTRHPAVTAGAIASIQELSGGRAFLGIGTGDSALANLGLPPTSLDGLSEYINTLKELREDGHSVWEGDQIELNIDSRDAPIYVSASGPKTLRLAGQIADGVVIGTGASEELVSESLESVRQGAELAGRSLSDIDIWWFLMANIAESDDVALNEIKNSLVTYANLAFRFTTAGKHLPQEHEEAIRRIHAEYRAMEHAKFGPSFHQGLADDLGVTSFLADRFAISGTPSSVAARIKTLSGMGIERIWLSIRVANKDRVLDLWPDVIADLSDSIE